MKSVYLSINARPFMQYADPSRKWSLIRNPSEKFQTFSLVLKKWVLNVRRHRVGRIILYFMSKAFS